MRGDALRSAGCVVVETLEVRRLLSAAPHVALDEGPSPRALEAEVPTFSARINFQPARRALVDGYLPDSGLPFGDRGNGLEYGWTTGKGKVGGRKPKDAPDARLNGFAVLRPDRSWEIAVPDGRYRVRVAAGDVATRNRRYRVALEGVTALDAFASPVKRWFETTMDVTVTDGRLTVSAIEGARGNKINFLHVDPVGAPDPLPEEPAPTPTTANITWAGDAPRSPIYRTESQVVQVGSKVYAIGGYTNGPGLLPDTRRCHVFDMATGKWKEIAKLPAAAATTHGSLAGDGSRFIYLVAGQVEGGYGQGTNTAWRYDITADRWQRFVDLPEVRFGGALAYADGWLHFFGGNTDDRQSITSDHWALNVQFSDAGWAPRAALPLPGDHLSHAVIGGQIYAIGGEHGHHGHDPNQDAPYVQHNYLLRYDPIADVWTRLADMPVATSHMEGSTLVINGKIVLIGGILTGGGRNTTASVRVYDPATNQWSVLATRYPKRIMGPTCGYWNGRIYMTDGYSPDSADSQAAFWGTVSGI